MDYVKQIVTVSENENGLRLDNKIKVNPTIKVDKLIPENMLKILNDIKMFSIFIKRIKQKD